MISFASVSAARDLFRADRVGREIDGAALIAHVERDGGEVVELLERGRQDVLARVLLHVIATALGVDRCHSNTVARLEAVRASTTSAALRLSPRPLLR